MINLNARTIAAPVLLCLAPVAATAADGPNAMQLPLRVLHCHLGHATNLDATREQSPAEIRYDSYHDLTLDLPAIAARSTPPPDATEPAEPVDPATRIAADLDHLTGDTTGPFNRVIDLWPDRVEMTMPMAGGISKLLILSNYDPQQSTAHLFMTDAADLATFDLKRTFIGDCKVDMTVAATAGA